MKTIHEPARDIPVFAEADVVVVGGGTAGVFAALAAAKNGADTILVEQLGHLGGLLLGGGLSIQGFFNNYLLYPEAGKLQVVRGLPETFLQRMVAVGGSYGHVENEIGSEIEPDEPIYDPIILQKVCFDMAWEYGVRLYTRTVFADALVEDDRITGIIVENKQGRGAILGKVFIDTTGDGDLAVRAGVPYIAEEDQDKRHHSALIFGLGHVDVQRALAFGRENDIVHMLARAHKGTSAETIVLLWLDLKKLPACAEAASEIGIWGPVLGTTRGDAIHYVNATNVLPASNLSVPDAVDAELQLWDKAFELAALLREHVGGFEEAYIKSVSPLLGVRRSRTIRCEYDITMDDIRQARGFPDEVARYAWTDIHTPEYQPVAGGSYGIPYRALLPRQVDGLLVAGRLITSQFEAHNSTRNTVNCMAQGEAVGTAAALSAARGVVPRELDTDLLQDTLLANDVYLVKQ
jgi:hypothetical protein